MKKFLLAILSLGAASVANAQCTELFFSEYVEGSSHNKALEVYNPTPAPINLNNYRLIRYSNGSPTPVDSVDLVGTIQAHDVWVIVNGQAVPDGNGAFCDSALIALGDQVGPANYVTGTAVLYMNGDDAIALMKISPRTTVDIFGKIGEDPGSSWSDVFPYTDAQGTWWTINHTLIRKPSVTGGVTTNPTAFNVTLEWDSLPENTWTNLGQHNSTCNASGIIANNKSANSITAFPNPSSNGFVTINANSGIASITVMNVVGETISSSTFGKGNQNLQQQIDLSTAPAGIYLVQVELANGQRTATKISIR